MELNSNDNSLISVMFDAKQLVKLENSKYGRDPFTVPDK